MEAVWAYILQYDIDSDIESTSPRIHRSIAMESWSLKLCRIPPSACLNLIAKDRKRMKQIAKLIRVTDSAVVKADMPWPVP